MNDIDTLLRFYTFGYKAGRRSTFRIHVKDADVSPKGNTYHAMMLHSTVKNIVARMYGIPVRDVDSDDSSSLIDRHPAWRAYCWGWGRGRDDYQSYWSVVVARELRSL